MGAPNEYFQGKQAVQQMQLDAAYGKEIAWENPSVLKAEIRQEVKPDNFDKIYVFLRSIVPDWLLLTFIFVGALTTGLIVFRKHIFGVLEIFREFQQWKGSTRKEK